MASILQFSPSRSSAKSVQRLLKCPAMLRQHLLVEFSGLKHACPQGVFMSLTPGESTLWSGVIFVREGPYNPAILRFRISFPPEYPSLPPLVIFETDMFHPLITPLSTLTYTTDIQGSGTVSATDEERLPPGGFSLRHGFPGWFGRASRSAANSRQSSAQYASTGRASGDPDDTSASGRETPVSTDPPPPRLLRPQRVSTYEVLRYIRSTFDDAHVLDSIPLEAAGNTGAWHAWRTHRLNNGVQLRSQKSSILDEPPASDDAAGSKSDESHSAAAELSIPPARKPGEWNWDGVWEVRSKKGIEATLAEPTLYGNVATGDDVIRFHNLDDDQLTTVKENMVRSMEAV